MSEESAYSVMQKLTEISERVARQEAILNNLSSTLQDDIRLKLREQEKRLFELETHKASTIGAKDIVTWLAVTGIAVWEVLSR